MLKVSYKGYEIFVEAGDGPEYKSFYIMRESDGWFVKDGFEYNGETESEMVENFKELVDGELQEEDPWGEKQEAEDMEAKGWKRVEAGWISQGGSSE